MKKWLVTIVQEDKYIVSVEAETEEEAKNEAISGSNDWEFTDTINFNITDIKEEADASNSLPEVQGEVSSEENLPKD